jgi:hypothetical protein
LSKLTLTLEGSTWAEIRAQCRDVLEAPGPIGQLTGIQAQALPATMPPLPLDRPAMPPAPVIQGNSVVCQEHGATMHLKPAGTNRQGASYAAGYRCPVSGCRSFVPTPVAVQ